MTHFVPRISTCTLIALFTCACVHASPTVVITVDVESLEALPLPDQIDLVCRDQVPCGLKHMAKMLQDRGLAGTFFLNVYERSAWGNDKMRSIAELLQGGGHDVALHTHPQWAYDPARPYMYSYSLEDQSRIVADGALLLKQWTGLPVVAHRAGAYSANRDTIEALTRSGIVLDSSLFLKHPHSMLNTLGLPSNLPSTIGAITEIPITVYQRQERPAIFGTLALPHEAIGKVDVDSIQSKLELTSAIDAMIDADLPFIVVFLHSFSFIAAPDDESGAPRSDPLSISIFSTLLDIISEKKLHVATTRELAEHRDTIGFDGNDIVPDVAITIPAPKYIVRMMRSHPAASVLAGALAMLIAGGAVFFGRAQLARKRVVKSAGNK